MVKHNKYIFRMDMVIRFVSYFYKSYIYNAKVKPDFHYQPLFTILSCIKKEACTRRPRISCFINLPI